MAQPVADSEPLQDYLARFAPLIGDKRTQRTFTAIVHGILGSASLVCARIAAFSPWPGGLVVR